MKPYFFLTIWLAMIPAAIVSAAAPDAPTVAVYDFTGEAEAANYGGKVAALLTADLAAETNLVMLERSELDKAIREQAFGISGMVSSDAAARIGEMTGAKVLVSGQVILTKPNHLVIIANIIGTETSRLFAAKVEGASDDLLNLTSELGRQISQTIHAQAANLIAASEESHAERLNRIIAGIKGTNRPSVSVEIVFYAEQGNHWRDQWAEYEFGAVLIKAGFSVLDDNSDRKPDIEITGDASTDWRPVRGKLLSNHTAVEVKLQERRTGKILAFDRQESTATGIGQMILGRISHVNAVDGLAERILPLLAK